MSQLPVRRARTFGLVAAILMFVACAASATQTIPVELAGETLRVELAVTPEEQARGLMFRQSLPENAGMLFIYEKPSQVSYWMKNTYVPLSIAFLDSDRRILNISDMAPLDASRTYPSRGPCRYVLEVNQGWFAKHGVKEGDVVTFELPARKKR